MWTLIDGGLRGRFRQHPQVRHDLGDVSQAVAEGRMTPAAAAHRLLGYLDASDTKCRPSLGEGPSSRGARGDEELPG
jgi:hypothetical protein